MLGVVCISRYFQYQKKLVLSTDHKNNTDTFYLTLFFYPFFHVCNGNYLNLKDSIKSLMASSFAFEKFLNGLRGMVFDIFWESNRCLTFESFAFKEDFDNRGKLFWAKSKNSSTVRDGTTYCLMHKNEKMYSSALLQLFWGITTSFFVANVNKKKHCQVNFWKRRKVESCSRWCR